MILDTQYQSFFFFYICYLPVKQYDHSAKIHLMLSPHTQYLLFDGAITNKITQTEKNKNKSRYLDLYALEINLCHIKNVR